MELKQIKHFIRTKLDLIKIDYDKSNYKKVLARIQALINSGASIKQVTMFNTRKGYHFYITFNETLNVLEIVYFKLYLCDDREHIIHFYDLGKDVLYSVRDSYFNHYNKINYIVQDKKLIKV